MTDQPAGCGKLFTNIHVPQRVLLSFFGFLGIVNVFTMRMCLFNVMPQLICGFNQTIADGTSCGSKTWKPMTKKFSQKVQNIPDVHSEVKPAPIENIARNSYDWFDPLQTEIFGSFVAGYVVAHVPGGLLAENLSAKWVFGIGILAAAIFTLLTPFAIEHGGSTWLIVVQTLMGLSQGPTFPALSVLLSSWVPIKERGKLGALALSGGQVGTMIASLGSGALLGHYEWPIVFYVFGGIGVVWFVIFTFVCFNNPAKSPFIGKSEIAYLKSEIGRKSNMPIAPFGMIMTSLPIWALISAQIGYELGFYIMDTDLPNFMSDVMHITSESNSFASLLPYVMMWIVAVISGVVADLLITKNILSITNTRKLMTGIAILGPAIFMVFMVVASNAGCNPVVVYALFTICMGLMGTFYAGIKLTPLDMSPNYAGTVMGITNGIGSTMGEVTPYLVGLLTPKSTLTEWHIVFWVAFGVLCTTAVSYILWASGTVQRFNDPSSKKDYNAEEESRRNTDNKESIQGREISKTEGKREKIPMK